jgi:hypothetical protein
MVGWMVNSDLENIWKEPWLPTWSTILIVFRIWFKTVSCPRWNANARPEFCSYSTLLDNFSRSDTHHAERHNTLPMLYIIYRILHWSYGNRLTECDLVWCVSGYLVGLINNAYGLTDSEHEGAPWTAEHLSTTQAIVYVRVLVFAAKLLDFIISLSVNPVPDVRYITIKILHTGRELPHLFTVYQGVSAFSGRPPSRRDRGCPGWHQERIIRHAGWII